MKETIILYFLYVKESIKLRHWTTENYSIHKSLGKLYEEFDEQIDDFVETMMGKMGRPEFSQSFNVEFESPYNYSELEVIDSCIEFLIGLTSQLDPIEDSDLLNKRDEMLGLMNKSKYLLTLQ